MKYPIYVYGSSVLRKENIEVTKDYPNLNVLIGDLFETMYASDGVGVAAPQVGKSLRMFVVDTEPMIDEEDEETVVKRVFINPEIYESSEEFDYYEEGCLSVPGLHEDVLRPVAIKIRFLNENFEQQDESFDGYAARVIQHEYDHLQGMLFTDRVAPLRKQLIKSKLDKISKGDFKSKFACKLVK